MAKRREHPDEIFTIIKRKKISDYYVELRDVKMLVKHYVIKRMRVPLKFEGDVLVTFSDIPLKLFSVLYNYFKDVYITKDSDDYAKKFKESA